MEYGKKLEGWHNTMHLNPVAILIRGSPKEYF